MKVRSVLISSSKDSSLEVITNDSDVSLTLLDFTEYNPRFKVKDIHIHAIRDVRFSDIFIPSDLNIRGTDRDKKDIFISITV